MIANYHTHTARCMHACGKDEEYVQKAIAEGVKILGFSDHCPTVYSMAYTSGYKMPPSMIEDYFSSLSSLRDKYADKIEIHIGYEAEFLPDVFEASFDLWRKAPSPEYLILGQHFTDFEIRNGRYGDHSYYGSKESPLLRSHERLTRYVDGVINAMSTDCFSCLAHPDLLTFTGDDYFYLEEMQRLIDGAKRYGVPLEYNLLGLRENRYYPNPVFWELVSKNKSPVILGCDAHDPEDVAAPENLKNAHNYLTALGIKPIDTMELRNPFK